MAGKTINSENNHVDVMNKDAEICLNSDTLLPGNSVGGVFGQPGGGVHQTLLHHRAIVIPLRPPELIDQCHTQFLMLLRIRTAKVIKHIPWNLLYDLRQFG